MTLAQQAARIAMSRLGFNVAANHPGTYPFPDAILAAAAAFERDGTFYDPIDDRQFKAPARLSTKRTI